MPALSGWTSQAAGGEAGIQKILPESAPGRPVMAAGHGIHVARIERSRRAGGDARRSGPRGPARDGSAAHCGPRDLRKRHTPPLIVILARLGGSMRRCPARATSEVTMWLPRYGASRHRPASAAGSRSAQHSAAKPPREMPPSHTAALRAGRRDECSQTSPDDRAIRDVRRIQRREVRSTSSPRSRTAVPNPAATKSSGAVRPPAASAAAAARCGRRGRLRAHACASGDALRRAHARRAWRRTAGRAGSGGDRHPRSAEHRHAREGEHAEGHHGGDVGHQERGQRQGLRALRGAWALRSKKSA